MTETKVSPMYYVPAKSYWPILAAIALFCLGLGSIHLIHAHFWGPFIFLAGSLLMAFVMFGWFGAVIKENQKGLYSEQMDRTFRWGMVWFIFSEIMFFGAFFGALFYVRTFAVPWLGGAGSFELTNIILWPDFKAMWPLYSNPNPMIYPGPKHTLGIWGIPALNTLILLSSAVAVTWAHWGLKKDNRKQLLWGLIITIALGLIFLGFQAYEYIVAHGVYGLTLRSGIYGSTFFMLTGFHAAHVTIGAIMLIVIFVRALKYHFTPEDHFGFEATAWYWHFVDVVWLLLFIFVYWI